MANLYYGYCPSCDQGLSWEEEDMQYQNGNKYIVCPNCGFLIIVPFSDTNKNGILDQNELSFSINNPNYMVLAEKEVN